MVVVGEEVIAQSVEGDMASILMNIGVRVRPVPVCMIEVLSPSVGPSDLRCPEDRGRDRDESKYDNSNNLLHEFL